MPRRQSFQKAFSLIFLLFIAGPVRASANEPTFAGILSAQPGTIGVTTNRIKIQRDAFSIEISDGTFYPVLVQSRIIGSVFLGHGRFQLNPQTRSERDYLALRTGKKELEVLSDTFEQAVFLFTDATWTEIQQASKHEDSNGSSVAQALYSEFIRDETRKLKVNLHLRILADILENRPPEKGFWAMSFKGKELPPVIACFDPRGLPSLGFDRMFGTETTAFISLKEEVGSQWYSRTPIGAGNPALYVNPVEAIHYEIDTTIQENLHVIGNTTIRVKAMEKGIRVVNLSLFQKLRIQKVTLGTSTRAPEELPFLQSQLWDHLEEASFTAVILPRPLDIGEEGALTITYSGDEVLECAGGDNYYVGVRTSWYPNLGTFTSTSTYSLTFRVSIGKDVVSIGPPSQKQVEGKMAIHRFTSEGPIRVAGFNYGTFNCLERKDPESGVTFRIYTNRGDTWLSTSLMNNGALVGNLNPERFREDTLADATNALRIGAIFFGPLKTRNISISQQAEWSFGQSWPSLVFLPYIAFMSSTQRVQLGMIQTNAFVDTVGFHELSHQWWGHDLGWATYRDQWLSEGFAEFSTGLSVQFTGGPTKYREFLERSRKSILGTGRFGSVRNFEGGPVYLGSRLASKQAPQGYQSLVYEKGGFILHMIRSMLYNGKAKDPEIGFKELMKDLTQSFAGVAITTEDFRMVVARHMDPALFGDMHWFFDQWVYGAEIPKLSQHFEVKDMGNGVYDISGSMSQSRVSGDFRSFVPVYVELERNRYMRIGQVILTGNATYPINFKIKLPKTPIRVEANSFFDLLTQN